VDSVNLRDSVFLLMTVIYEFGVRGMRVTIRGDVREVCVNRRLEKAQIVGFWM